MKREQMRLFSVAAVVVAAVLFGMVLAGGLNLTPRAVAERPAVTAQPAASAAAPDFAALADRVVPSVVSIYAKDIVKPDERRRGLPDDPFHRFFGPFMRPDQGQREPTVRTSSGSGFFISADGELLTNNHVVEDADSLEIELNGGTRYAVKVVGRDPSTDIALVRVENADREFPVLALGDSDTARVGAWVMAVGNPLNMDHTVTVGVVSAKGRVLGLSDTSFENYIQTDAAINRGNSGGPLVDLGGRVIGINTAISAGGQNLGFAVPANTASLILPQLRQHGKVVRGYLGVTVGNVTQEVQEAFDLDSRMGAFVQEVLPDHAADRAGLEHGDVIVSVNGTEIANTRQLIDRISATPPGDKVELGVIRKGKRIQLKAKLEERSAGEGEAKSSTEEGDEGSVSERVGITVGELTPRLRQAFGVDDAMAGVVVTHVAPVSPAGDEGLRPGDVITEANGVKVSTPEAFLNEVKSVKGGGYLRLYVYRPRAERSFFAILKLEK